MKAAGALGWDERTFWLSTPIYLYHALQGYQDARTQEYKTAWEVAQMLAAFSVAPHVKNAPRPKDLLPLPWQKPDKVELTPIDPEVLRKFNESADEIAQKRYGWQAPASDN